MRFCLIDFETASTCDLKKAGAHRYAEDVTTEILCLGWTDGLESIVLAQSDLAYSDNSKLATFVNDPDCIFIAHNVAFEKAIWRNLMIPLGWPDIPNERWHDILAVCAMKGLPLKLERAATALNLKTQKDKNGSRFTVSLSKPNRTGKLNRTPEAYARVFEYNRSDLAAELEVHRTVRGLGSGERQVWLLDQRMNERGIRLDIAYIEKCQSIVDQATKPLAAEFEQLVGCRPNQLEKFKEWLIAKGCPFPKDAEGNLDTSLGKEAIVKILGEKDAEDDSLAGDEEDWQEEELQIELPFDFRRPLFIRQILSSASIKKLAAMRSCLCSDGRARGLLQYHGAGPGRWAGRLFQPQNFPRPTLKQVTGFKDGKEIYGNHDPEQLVESIMSGDAEWVRCLFGEPIEAVANGLRHALIPSDGNLFEVGDYSKIECVIVLALAGAVETAANVIKNGSAVYTDMAAQIFHRPVLKTEITEYTIGKAVVLGAGFQMGWRKFKFKYAQNESDETCQAAIKEYREHFAPEVPKLWWALERAAVDTVWTKKAHMAYGVTYALEDRWLTVRLPSGRKLWYYDPKPVRKPMPWDKTDIRPGFEYSAWKTGQWKRISAYGGLLTENVVQATARDLLVSAMLRCDAEGRMPVLSVHDEIVNDVLAARADSSVLRQIMCDRPAWAIGSQIPVDAETWIGSRYRK